jgi:hypothetical protein
MLSGERNEGLAMSRVLRAGTPVGPPSRPIAKPAAGPAASGSDRHAARGFTFQDLPSGLASLVVHFTVLIVLGLVVTESTRPHLSEVVVNWDEGTDELAGGGGGTDGTEDVADPPKIEEALGEDAAELAQAVPDVETLLSDPAVTSEWGEVTADIAPAVASTDAGEMFSDFASMGDGLLRGIGTGGGRGGGRGRGDGDGIGDGTGPGSATGVFGLRDEGQRIVYVFDRSESMNSVFTLTSDDGDTSVTFLEAAKEELTKSVKELSNGSEFHMIFYNSTPMAFVGNGEKLVKVDEETKEFAQRFIYQLVAENNTNHVMALAMALELQPDVVFLMTDGEFKDDPTRSDLNKLQRMARRGGTRINVIHFVFEPRTNSSLESLARRTQGQFRTIHIRSLIDPEW